VGLTHGLAERIPRWRPVDDDGDEVLLPSDDFEWASDSALVHVLVLVEAQDAGVEIFSFRYVL
jgi:hypothetical protein